jgi:hypothetical protein
VTWQLAKFISECLYEERKMGLLMPSFVAVQLGDTSRCSLASLVGTITRHLYCSN